MMRALTGFPLDDDIIDLLLQTLDDFQTLVCFVVSCKAVHAVYTRRQHSILERIARNQVGGAFEQALKLARIKKNVENLRRAWREADGPVEEDAEEERRLEEEEAAEMARSARTVFGLEGLFSWRYVIQPDCGSP